MPERSLGFGFILDTAFALYRQGFGLLAALGATFLIPAGALQLLATLRGHGSLPGLLLSLLAGYLMVCLWTAVAVAGDSLLRGSFLTYREVLRRTAGLLPALAVTSAVLLAVVGAGILAFVLPGIYALVHLSLTPQVLALEGLPPLSALSRSYRLVRGRALLTFAVLLLSVGITFLFTLFASIPVILGAHASRLDATILAQGYATALQVLTFSFPALAMTVLHLHLSGELERRLAEGRS